MDLLPLHSHLRHIGAGGVVHDFLQHIGIAVFAIPQPDIAVRGAAVHGDGIHGVTGLDAANGQVQRVAASSDRKKIRPIQCTVE